MGSTALQEYVSALFQRPGLSQLTVVFDDAALPTNELLERVLPKTNRATAEESRVSCQSIDIMASVEFGNFEEGEEYNAYRLGESTILEMETSDWLSDGSTSSLLWEQSVSQERCKDSTGSYHEFIPPNEAPQPKISVQRTA